MSSSITRLALLLALVPALLLGACEKPSPPPPAPTAPAPAPAPAVAEARPVALVDAPVLYQCQDYAFSARFGEGDVVLLLPEGQRLLKQVSAASGTKYEGEQALFWVKGREALLEIDGRGYDGCREQAATADAAPATSAPAFTARGNEPGWSLRIVPGEQMQLVTDYGQRTVETAAPPALEKDGARIYHARSRKHELYVRIESTPCQDDSGAPFPSTVLVKLDGKELRGCGSAPG